jgi:hypothetical protein
MRSRWSSASRHPQRGAMAHRVQAQSRATLPIGNIVGAFVHRLIGAQLPEALGVEHAKEAVALVEWVLTQLDPLHPPYHWLSLACPLYFAGRYTKAIAALEKISEPRLHVRVMLALSDAQADFRDQAWAQAREVLRLDPGFRGLGGQRHLPAWWQRGGAGRRRDAQGRAAVVRQGGSGGAVRAREPVARVRGGADLGCGASIVLDLHHRALTCLHPPWRRLAITRLSR